ncbi:LysR family transcriptional regulator [Phenylobacterium sp.]|uniref:LysR family transcriptional regulator n=1 Tax=Phenylobacterium sp. TaxID=1871053 RepID=UPI00301BEEE4
MDISLARTFLEVVATGSFVGAADRLHLTQTAISARIRLLEEQVGRRLFVRNRAGARLTPAGERFQHYATTLVQVWERARQQIALPPGRAHLVGLGGEFSLWSPLLVDWMLWMREHQPDVALRTEVDTAENLLRRVQEGSLDVAVLYSPPQRPELVLELLVEEKLVLVTTADDGEVRPEDYIFVDWGEPFTTSHATAFPHLVNAGVSISLGPLALSYMLAVGGAGYFRSSVVQPYIDGGQLRRVGRAPEFAYSIYAVYSTRSAAEDIQAVRESLRLCAKRSHSGGPPAAPGAPTGLRA